MADPYRILVTGSREPHPMAEACADEHCSFHGLDEQPEGAWRVCFECGHAYRTAADLLAAHNEVMAGAAVAEPGGAWVPETEPERVFCCPLCAHDW